jgi:ABC-type transporter Mla maintaining outer membrane lipid asymmetry ATPase subunit MlaF
MPAINGADRSPGDVQPLLSVRALSAHYGQRRALADVSVDVRPGEVVALVLPAAVTVDAVARRGRTPS